MNKLNFYAFHIGSITLRDIGVTDVLEIAFLTIILFFSIRWIWRTRVRNALFGIFALIFMFLVASWAKMETILWIGDKVISIAAVALVILFQPELRKALDQMGQTVGGLWAKRSHNKAALNDNNIEELVTACFEMGRAKTGALIVIEREQDLGEYVNTGIPVDALISSQLLLNIFEHNTPLHDGAVIVQSGRIAAATCYLPLSDSLTISKALGTRHRAGVGISERTDSLTIIVSEETGYVSVAQEGRLRRHINADGLRDLLVKTFGEKDTSGEKKTAKPLDMFRSLGGRISEKREGADR